MSLRPSTPQVPAALCHWGALVLCRGDADWLRPQLSALLPWVSRVVIVDARDERPSELNGAQLGYGEHEVQVAPERGDSPDVLNAALALLDTPNVLVLEEREFLRDLREVQLAIERLPRAASVRVKRTSFVGGPDQQVTPEDKILIACRPERGFAFHSYREGQSGVHERVDVEVLSYARLAEDPREAPDNADLKRYTNEHPLAAARYLNLAAPAPAPQHEPLVSIIVPFYAAQDVTRACVEALLRAATTETCPSFEVILRDDGGPGASQGLESVLADPRVRLSTATENQGFLRTVNSAAGEARGRYLVLLNNDTLPLPGWLEALVQLAENDPQVGVVGAMLLYPDGVLQEAGGIVFSDASGWNYGKRDKAHHDRYQYVREVDYCSGAAILVRRELWEAIGGFDERFAPAYYEDTDLCMQARERGYKVLYQPRARVVHLEGYSSGTDVSQGVKRYQEINKAQFLDKWKTVLEREHRPPGSNPHVARQRTSGKHVLLANPGFAYFDRDSGSFRLLQIIKVLGALGHRVTFLARSWCGNVFHRKHLEELGIETRIGRLDSERDMGNGATLQVVLKELVQDTPIELALLYHYTTARKVGRYLRRHSPLTRIVTDTVDVHFLRLERRAEVTGDAGIAREAKRVKSRELSAYKASDLVLAISEEEARFLRPLLPRTPVDFIPNIHPIPEQHTGPEGREDLLFIGSFAHPPNGDALEYLVKKIMPLVWQRRPAQVLTVVGGGVDSKLDGLASERVRFLGFVDDLDPILYGTRMLVAPLRFGAGAKGKVGQALSYGLPVVTSPVGSEGLGMTHGHDYLLAETPSEFADAIVRLCEEPALWQKLASNGIDLIEGRFSTNAVARMLEERVLTLGRHEPGLRRKWLRLQAYVR